MGKIRIYELAKELGVGNKVVITKAAELGIGGKTSHSNSLEDGEADQIRRAIIRQALGSKPESKVVTTLVDKSTGEKRTVVESRKGNIIRRRKGSKSEEPKVEAPSSDVAEEESAAVVETAAVSEADALFKDTEESTQPVAETAEAVEVQADAEVAPEVVEAEEEVEEEKKVAGPRVLGKIDLPQKKAKPAKKKVSPSVVVVDDDVDDEEGRKDGRGRGRGDSKRRSRKREFTRTDLVDYDGRAPRRSNKKSGRKGGGRDDKLEADDTGPASTELTTPKASKRIVKMDEAITVGEFARQMSMKVSDVISKLIDYGVMATINQVIDQDTATIVAEEFGFQVEYTGFDESTLLIETEDDQAEDLKPRPPVVTVMGHVDHGKTSLLDMIRSASVAAREHGGITQHIGAYMVDMEDGREIAFIDTPGHAAFTSMRARGANVTDIVVLVVAADDGVMPQTVEAIDHARAAEVPIVVAVNKMDKPDAQPDRVKQQLAERGLQPEDWSGDTMFFNVSALEGTGIQELLEGLLLLAEMKELKANYEGRAGGVLVEARQEKGKGTVATVLVQRGTLNVGDIFVSGAEFGRVRSMVNHLGVNQTSVGPSVPVEISGFSSVPMSGDDFVVVESEAVARQVAAHRSEVRSRKAQAALAGGPISLEEFARRTKLDEVAELRVIVKADVHGSLEAVKESAEELSQESVKVKVLHGGVGGVNESDVQLALASQAIIVGFNVRAEPRAMAEAEANGVDIRFYRVIYELIDDVKMAMAGLLAPIQKEVSVGRAEVRDTFSVPKIGTVAGCYVLDGYARRGSHLRLIRDNIVVHEGRMLNLRRFKDDVKEVQSGYECGISIDGYNDIKRGDVLELYEIKEEAATLD